MASLPSSFFGVQRRSPPALPRAYRGCSTPCVRPSILKQAAMCECPLPWAARSPASICPLPPAPDATKEDILLYALNLHTHHTEMVLENQSLKAEIEAAHSKLFETTYKLMTIGIFHFFLDKQPVKIQWRKGQDYHEVWSAVLQSNSKFHNYLAEDFESTTDMLDFLVQCHQEFNSHHHQGVKRDDMYVFDKAAFFSPQVGTVLRCMAQELLLNIKFYDN